MKLNEIHLHESAYQTDHDKIKEVLRIANIDITNFCDGSIGSDGSVIIRGDFLLPDNGVGRLIGAGALPLHFALVEGAFSIMGQKNITSLNWLPKKCSYRINIAGSGITSLIGIHDIVESMDGTFRLTLTNIKSGGIGLILINGIQKIQCDNSKSLSISLGGRSINPFTIIEKYLGRPEDIFECQAELIEAGYEEYSQL